MNNMKKEMTKNIFVAAIAMVCGVCIIGSQKSRELSDVALANVEALAEKDVVTVCGGCSSYFLSRECCRLIIGDNVFILYYEK